jgi:hypothetical protein
MAILIGGAGLDILLIILFALLDKRSVQGRHRRQGVPRPPVVRLLFILLLGLNGCAFGLFILGGPEVQTELTRRRQLANVTQRTTATVDTHTCVLAMVYDTDITYHFTAPDPATGRPQIYTGREHLVPAEPGCGPVTTPYATPIWYDPTNPQRATVQPPPLGRLILLLLLLFATGGLCGVLPLAEVIRLLWFLLWLKRRAAQPFLADVQQMDAAGFQVALHLEVRAAARAAEHHPTMGAYMRRLNGELYISLDFIENPVQRAIAWNALWRVQSDGGTWTGDEAWTTAILRLLKDDTPVTDAASAHGPAGEQPPQGEHGDSEQSQ